MTSLEKIQRAIELTNEVKEASGENGIIQMFIENSLSSLKCLEKWIKNED
jgi:hypothetical protein